MTHQNTSELIAGEFLGDGGMAGRSCCVEAGEEAEVVQGDFEAGLAVAGGAAAEFEGDFSHFGDGAADEDFQQKLEAGGLEDDVADRAAADEEEARHGVCYASAGALEGVGEAYGDGGRELAQGVPTPELNPFGVAAGDGNVAAVFDCGDEGWEDFGGVLKVGVHDAEDGGGSVLPAVEDGSGEAALALADEEADARVFACDGADEFGGAVAAVIIDDENFVIGAGGVEYCAHAGEERGEAAGFVEGGDDEGEFARG